MFPTVSQYEFSPTNASTMSAERAAATAAGMLVISHIIETRAAAPQTAKQEG